jgi:hypothetical protein
MGSGQRRRAESLAFLDPSQGFYKCSKGLLSNARDRFLSHAHKLFNIK